jgi:hypothetical protein
MICRLCKKDKPLKNSHIIPEFIYGPLYDEKHRFHVLSTLKTTKNAKLQKGIREKLLRGDCEGKLSVYERYVSLIFSGAIPSQASRNGKFVTLEGLEYDKFKLFALSVLWRAGVSNLPFFAQVSLGPHEEKLREMILNEKAGEPDEYSFMMVLVTHEDVVQTDLIIQPTWSRLEGHYSYRFVYGGIAWIYLLSSHKTPNIIANATLSKASKTTMLVSEASNMPFIVDFVNELKAN